MSERRFETTLVASAPSRGKVQVADKPPLEIVPPPEFGGPPGFWTPEDLLVAAVESCLMVTFTHLATGRALEITAYRSRANGAVTTTENGVQFSRIDVFPRIEVRGAQAQIEQAQQLLKEAERLCLVSRSLQTEVRVFAYLENSPEVGMT